MKSALEEYLKRNSDILAVYLFGSRAEGVERPRSDTDIAVLLMSHIDKRHYSSYRLRLLEELSSFFAGQLDLIILNQVPLLLQFQVLKSGKLLFERDADKRAELEMHMLSRYYDARRYYEFHFNKLIERIEQRGLGHGRARDSSQTQEAR